MGKRKAVKAESFVSDSLTPSDTDIGPTDTGHVARVNRMLIAWLASTVMYGLVRPLFYACGITIPHNLRITLIRGNRVQVRLDLSRGTVDGKQHKVSTADIGDARDVWLLPFSTDPIENVRNLLQAGLMSATRRLPKGGGSYATATGYATGMAKLGMEGKPSKPVFGTAVLDYVTRTLETIETVHPMPEPIEPDEPKKNSGSKRAIVVIHDVMNDRDYKIPVLENDVQSFVALFDGNERITATVQVKPEKPEEVDPVDFDKLPGFDRESFAAVA